jgi:hypothetical protein
LVAVLKHVMAQQISLSNVSRSGHSPGSTTRQASIKRQTSQPVNRMCVSDKVFIFKTTIRTWGLMFNYRKPQYLYRERPAQVFPFLTLDCSKPLSPQECPKTQRTVPGAIYHMMSRGVPNNGEFTIYKTDKLTSPAKV